MARIRMNDCTYEPVTKWVEHGEDEQRPQRTKPIDVILSKSFRDHAKRLQQQRVIELTNLFLLEVNKSSALIHCLKFSP